MSCTVQLHSFGPTETNPRNMGTWAIEMTIGKGTYICDFVQLIPVYWENLSLKLIIEAIVKKEDLTGGVFIYNGERVIDFDFLKRTIMQDGDVISILPQLIAG